MKMQGLLSFLHPLVIPVILFYNAEAMVKQKIEEVIKGIVIDMSGEDISFQVERPQDPSHGDYATNVALVLTKKLKKAPLEIATLIADKLLEKGIDEIENVSVAPPGFVNIHLSQKFLINELGRVLSSDELEKSSKLKGKKILVEYAHPNTHKEMHIGHMRTLITGESVSRLLEAAGAVVFRANYQGDIGPHVAKALFGIQEMLKEEGKTLEDIRSWSNYDKAHFLGRGYAYGSQKYEENKDAIDNINMQLYANDPKIADLYEETRQWSLEYYDEFYSRFGTRFDKLFFESQMVDTGKRIVEENSDRVFSKENGAVIFAGEKYGLHTRVFITQAGNPTYEGKEMGNALAEYDAFQFDRKIHVVANEQAGYFQVVFKALELIDPEKFKDKQFHLSMGMVQLTDRKMSSRTGDVLTVDWLLDQVKEKVEELITEGRIESDKKAELTEQIVIGAVKYSVLKVGVGQDVSFDIQKSVSLEGDSGPYLQYSFARTQSVLRKSETDGKFEMENLKLESEELQLLKLLSQFNEVVIEASERLSPNTVATYLYELASAFNLFYQKHSILKAENEVRAFRLALTEGVGKTLKRGLGLLGISAPEKM